VHVHEEDADDLTVWRRPSAQLPPSRGRRGFALRADGSAEETGPGPTDRPTHTNSAWRLETGEPPCLCIERRGAGKWHLDIVDAAPDRLLVREHFD
jgi:hypothetical protein